MPCPQDIFSGMGEVPTRKVRWRVGLDPGYAVEDLVSEFSEATGDREDIMICPTYPDSAAGFQFVAAGFKPGVVEFIVFFKSFRFVPCAFVYGDHPSALYADASVGEVIRRVGEDHIELEFEGVQEFDTVSLQ